MSGSFLPTENAGIISRTGGLSVSLAGPDGRVVGGVVVGLLMAASPVQVNILSFYLCKNEMFFPGCFETMHDVKMFVGFPLFVHYCKCFCGSIYVYA